MKTMKKMMALVIAMMMVAAMSVSVFATGGDTPAASDKVTITVNRDTTYAGDTSEAGRAFTWYKIFSATYENSVSTNASGYESDGSATFDNTATEGIAYYASAAVAAVLEGSGNLWFDLQDISGSTEKVVTWKAGVTADADTMQTAAAWLIENNAYESTGSMTFNGSSAWTASVDKGYYVIKSDVGDNLVAATTDITINEKNDYPPLDKTQADEDASAQGNAEVKVAVGDTITYEVKVTIPKTAAVGNTIEVWDTPSAGLDYQDDVAVKAGSNTGNATIADGTVGTGEIWHKVITVTEGSQGTDVVFTFTCVITADALTDTERENEAQLKYGNNYESLPDTVTYTTYFSGIHKVDGSTGLKGVKFTLKEDGVEFKVTKTNDGYYIPDASGSSEVVTNADGYIIVRGLDDDKTYTLTETETLPGYNMLEEDVTLSLVEDKDDAFDNYNPDSYQDVENNQGTTLPSTGGMGTTIFYIIGAVLVLGAGILLVTRRRMNAN